MLIKEVDIRDAIQFMTYVRDALIKEVETSKDSCHSKEIEYYNAAIAALDKADAAEPGHIAPETLLSATCCPKCREAVELLQPYCDECGQALNWEKIAPFGTKRGGARNGDRQNRI